MSLRLLLDENLSPVVATQVQSKDASIALESIYTRQGGIFVGASDPVLLAALHDDKRTLLTYDMQMLSEWSALFTGETAFSGVVFIDNRTIPAHDFGSLVRAIVAFWETEKEADWTNRIAFLASAP